MRVRTKTTVRRQMLIWLDDIDIDYSRTQNSHRLGELIIYFYVTCDRRDDAILF